MSINRSTTYATISQSGGKILKNDGKGGVDGYLSSIGDRLRGIV